MCGKEYQQIQRHHSGIAQVVVDGGRGGVEHYNEFGFSLSFNIS